MARAASDGETSGVTPAETASPEGELTQILKDLIRQEGPIGVDAFMAAALSHPRFGYYMVRDPIGQRGDFTTAPEISQIFGELIGAWCVTLWQSLGCPTPLRLVEMGPGRGTLMADLLRIFKQVAKSLDGIFVHFVETSPILKQSQATTLARHHPDIGPSWHPDFTELPAGPAIIVANEFLDALPIRQWVRRGFIWTERRVGIDDDGKFTFVDGAAGDPIIQPQVMHEGDIFETNAPAVAIAQNIGLRLSRYAGAALIIDYGHTRSASGETLQAVGHHRYANVLDDPGTVDLTAHVDFETVGNALRFGGARVTKPITQRDFLRRLGGEIRAELLAAGKDTETSASILNGFQRLVHPEAMGQLFKVIAAASSAVPFLPGFEAL